jgi:hypothetical protein
MHIKETLASGLVIGTIGGATALYSAINHEIGELSNIGPGAAPTGLGVLLFAFGLALVVQSVPEQKIAWTLPLRNIAFVVLAVLCFGLLVEPFGLFPAVFLGGSFGALADRENGIKFSIVLGLSLATLCTLTFVFALGLPIDAIRWGR